ncbi:MAG: hypothetical protein WCQ99_07845, partial [Pseudomonadota bacterium]
MQLKKYQAPTIHEALKKIKIELGDDAVIFDSRTIKSDNTVPRRQSRQWVEVTAAIERKAGKAAAKDLSGAFKNAASYSTMHGHTGGEGIEDSDVAALYKGFSVDCEKSLLAGEETFFPYLKNMIGSGISRDLAWYLLGEASSEFKKGGNACSLQTILLQKIGCRIPAAEEMAAAPAHKKI